MRTHRTVTAVALAAMLLPAAGCRGGENPDPEASPPRDTTAGQLPELPEGTVRIFESERGDLDGYALAYLTIIDGEASVEVWPNDLEEPEEEDFEVVRGTEGETVEFSDGSLTFVEIDPDHDPPYLTLALDE